MYEGNLLSIHVGDTFFFIFGTIRLNLETSVILLSVPLLVEVYLTKKNLPQIWHVLSLCPSEHHVEWSHSLAGLLEFKQYDKKDFKV